MRLRHLGQREAREVRVAEVEHTRAEGEAPVREMHVAELDEREQEAPRRRTREPGGTRHVAERELAVLGVEGTNHRQPPLEGRHEV